MYVCTRACVCVCMYICGNCHGPPSHSAPSASEDPRLSAGLTYAFVTGGQTPDESNYMLAAACCKHYAAYDIESNPGTLASSPRYCA